MTRPRPLRAPVTFLVAALVVVAGAAGSGCSDPASLSSSSGGSSGASSGDVTGDPGASSSGTSDAGASSSGAGGSSGTSSGSSGASGSGGGPSTGTTGTCPVPGQAHKTGLTSLVHANGLRYGVYAPASYDKNVGHTVVVLMHGQDSNGVPELNALWKPIADTDQLVLVAPTGSRAATNSDPNGANWATADLSKVLDVMTTVDGCYNVFTKKHVLWGFSEGGFYGYLLGIGAATRFSGLAMGGANTSFARQNGYSPSSAPWKIPVSDVHGKQDQNPISATYQDRTDFQAAGSVFTLHEHDGGHSITLDQVKMQWADLKASSSP
jgi:predicted esterase